MNVRRTIIKTACCLLLSACFDYSVSAQDVHFSQFYECAALRNPALTGIFSGDYRVAFNYRNQWSSFAVPFQTALMTAEAKALLREATHDYLSFGLTTIYDKAGSIDFTGFSVYGAVNYNKSLGGRRSSYLSVGLCGGYIQRSFDVTKMTFSNQFTGTGYNASAPSGEPLNFGPIHHWDASAGISLSGGLSSKANYYVGAAAYHVSKPSETYYGEQLIRLSTRWTGSMGLNARLGQGVGLNVHLNYQHQDPYEEFIGGMMLSRGFRYADNNHKLVLYAGCFYRLNDAIIPTLRTDYDNWSLTVSYDVSVSNERLYLSGFGGYEMTLSFRGKYPDRPERTLNCPQFELLESEAEW
jgi:type IX secretion system PorP/SprF family membrane protein